MAIDRGRASKVREVRDMLAELSGPLARTEGDFERVSLPATDADVLRDLLIAERPQVVVEIGLAYGSSALAIAEALLTGGPPKPRHVIIDAFQDRFNDAGWDAITTAGLGDVCCLIREPSQIVLPRLMTEDFVADAAFVDGSHLFHNVFVDLYFLGKVTRPGGLVILDDCDWPSVATAARYFELNVGWLREAISGTTRLAAFRLPDPRSEPKFEEFTSFAIDTST